MDKQKSITRSKQLHRIGQDLIHQLEQVPCGLQHSQIEMQHHRKKSDSVLSERIRGGLE